MAARNAAAIKPQAVETRSRQRFTAAPGKAFVLVPEVLRGLGVLVGERFHLV